MRTCELEKYEECSRAFEPKRDWQKCCCEAHARRLRWLRRKDRLKAAATVKVEITSPIKVEHPRMSVKVEGIT